MPEPHPDPRPFVPPIGIDDKPLPGGAPGLQVTTIPTGGGEIVVSSDVLLAQVAALERLRDSLRRAALAVLGLIDWAGALAACADYAPPRLHSAITLLHSAAHELNAAALRAEGIASAIIRSEQAYAEADHWSQRTMHFLDEQVAWATGVFVRVESVPIALTILEAAGSAILADRVFHVPDAALGHGAQDFLKQHPGLITSPATVAIVREIASDVDGFDAGFGGVPLFNADENERNSTTGVRSAAATVVADGNALGLFKETPVVVRRTTSFDYDTPPTSIFDRAIMFPNPHGDANGEQIRIDKYVVPGQPDRFDVYIAGTVTFDPTTGSEPFDGTSDLRGVAGLPTASTTAVEQAMAKAGVTSSTPVVLNGYSQGGLIASAIAASGHYDVKGVLTFGAPSGQVQIPASVPVLSVRNAEDLVPATSGYDVNPNAVVVQRAAFANQPIPEDWAVPAHRIEYYQQTAAVVDTASSPEILKITKILDSFGAGAKNIESSLWVATRTDGSPTIPPLVPTPSSSLPAREAVAG